MPPGGANGTAIQDLWLLGRTRGSGYDQKTPVGKVRLGQAGCRRDWQPSGGLPQFWQTITGRVTMRWKGRRGSENVEDRRSMRGPAIAGGGLLGLFLILAITLLGGDPRPLMQEMQKNQPARQAGPARIDPAPDGQALDEQAQMVAVILADTEDVWKPLFRASGKAYREPKLVMFRGQVQSACGFGCNSHPAPMQPSCIACFAHFGCGVHRILSSRR